MRASKTAISILSPNIQFSIPKMKDKIAHPAATENLFICFMDISHCFGQDVFALSNFKLYNLAQKLLKDFV